MNGARVKELLREAVETYKEFCHEDVAASFARRVREAVEPKANRCPKCGLVLEGIDTRDSSQLCWCSDDDPESSH